MFGRSVGLGRWFGVEVRIDASWAVLALLFGWSFYGLFANRFVDLETAPLLGLAIGTSIIFFGSVIVHELAHSLVARRLGIEVEGITLFMFGGVTKTKLEAGRARDEFWIAAVGPLASLALGGIGWLVTQNLGDVIAAPIRFAIGYLAWINVALAVFNMLPGFPLDGGRVLRSIVWAVTGSLTRATRVAATGGRFVGAAMAVVGLARVFIGSFGGLWMAAIGWFLYQAATYASRDLVIKQQLADLTAASLLGDDPPSVPADMPLEAAVEQIFLRFDRQAYPVISNGELVGIVQASVAEEVARTEWPLVPVRRLMTSLEEEEFVDPDLPMGEVLDLVRQAGVQRVLVGNRHSVIGVLTSSDISGWLGRSDQSQAV